MPLPQIVIVGADKGGVGKTTVARALMDYFKGQGMDARAFDNQVPDGNLKRFFPAKTAIVDLLLSDDQMKVFDTLAQSAVTVIDVQAGMLSKTIKILADVGLLAMVRDGTMKVAVLHVVGNSVASIDEIKATAEALAGAQHFVVKNHTNDGNFFAGLDSVSKDTLKNSIVIDIPKLDASATEHVDASNLPFVDFIADPSRSFTMKGHVRTWLAEVFKALDVARLNR
jgi:hypothetical protein